MYANIILKSGAAYVVDASRDSVCKEWDKALTGDPPLRTYNRLRAGIPSPKVTIDLREISSVEDYRGCG